jgi:hypothetical protein
LMWMTKNGGEDFRIEHVPQARYEGEQDEEADIEDEKKDRYDLEPVAIVIINHLSRIGPSVSG